MKIKEIRDKENDALQQELKERQKHLFDLRTQAVTEKQEDNSQLQKARRDIARILTVLRQRQLEQQPKRQPAQAAPKAEKKAKADKPKGEKPKARRREKKVQAAAGATATK